MSKKEYWTQKPSKLLGSSSLLFMENTCFRYKSASELIDSNSVLIQLENAMPQINTKPSTTKFNLKYVFHVTVWFPSILLNKLKCQVASSANPLRQQEILKSCLNLFLLTYSSKYYKTALRLIRHTSWTKSDFFLKRIWRCSVQSAPFSCSVLSACDKFF